MPIATIRTYTLLAKPGILFGNIVTTSAGFLLGAQGSINPSLFATTVIGLALVIASACIVNNYIDRRADAKMERTRNRPLALGIISGRNALLFASLLAATGLLFLGPTLAMGIALAGFFIYTVPYSFSKYASRHATLIGSLAGATPPVVGYCAAAHHCDAGALILFAMLLLWQLPHFYAIALYRLKDYTAASLPVLPVAKGIRATQFQMLFTIALFTAASSLLPLHGSTLPSYLFVSLPLSLCWLSLSIWGFWCKNPILWARKMFSLSLVVILGICTAIAFSLPA